MTSTNYGKEVKSNQTSGPKGKTYYIELYKSLESKLNEASSASERTSHLCEAWRRVHSLCLHSAPTTHPHLLSWLQRHTARTVLQTTWQTADRKDERSQLEESINVFIVESRALSKSRDGESPAWETQLVARGEWFKKILDHPWKHPVLNGLLNPDGTPPTDDEVLEWLKEERGVTFVMRLQTLVAEKKCDDIATILATAVMDRVRKDIVPVSDADQSDEAKNKPEEAPSFGSRLKEEAGFTVDVWEMLVDIEFVLLHKRDSSRCIALAKLTPLRSAYQLIERLQSRLETSPREKRLWKSSKEVAVLIAQVVIARCMVVQQCTGGVRSALYCCARSLARLMASSRLPSAAAALAAPAPTAVHLHTLAAAIDAQLAQNNETGMKPFVCELYVRAITAGMNELERLKLKTEKDTEARLMEQTLASWFVQLGCVLARSDRVKCECALTAFSLHPSPQMYERIKSAPLLPPVHLDSIEQSSSEATNPQFGSWASDSRSQTNFVKTSETLNMKARQSQANVLSTAILNEGEALGLSTDICQDITVLLSGPRVKTLSWDMDRELLLENCRAYLERTHGGTKAVTTELKYLNLNPDDFQYLPEEDEDENNIYYGIEKGYEHLVEQEPEGIWENPYDDLEKTETANSSDEYDFIQPQRKKKTKKIVLNTDEDDPLSTVAENKRKEKKERPHSKERSRDRKKITELEKMEEKIPGDPLEKIPGDPLEINDSEDKKKDKPKRERKKKEKVPKPEGALSSLVGLKVGRAKKKTKNQLLLTDSDADSQDKVSTKYFNYEDNVQYDGQFSMDELKSSSSSYSDRVSYRQNEFSSANGRAGMGYKSPQAHFNMPYRPQSVSTIRVPSPSSYKSPSDHSRNNSPTFISNEVKTSITKLLEYRRLKSVEDRKKPSAIINPDDAHPMDKDISPKGVAIPEIPKSYINKQQSEHLAAELKQRVDDMIKYRKNSAIPSPVIQYASKHDTSPDKQYPSTSHYNASHYNIQKDRMTPSTSERCFSTPPSADKFMDSVNLVSIYDKDEPTHSRNPFTEKSLYPSVSRDRQLNAKTSDVNYQDYLHEYHKLNTYSHYAEKEEQKKVMRPISRVIPVVPKIKSDHKTPQSAKQMPQKPDGSLNTFSRLSYYKNKQTDKNKALDMSQQPQTVGSKLDGFIMNELRQSHNSTPRPLNDVQPMVKKLEKPTSARDQHPIMANILQGHSSQTQFQQKSVIPPKTILSDKDHNDLLLLLRQKNMLNKSQNSPNASSSKTVHNTQNSKAISSSTDAVYDTNPSHMNNMASPNLMTKNPNLMTSNLNLRSQPSLRTTNPTLVTSNPNLRTSNPSLTVSSPSLVASNPNMKTPNPNLTNPSLMASQLSLASSSLKPSNTSIRSSNPSLMGSSHSLTTSNPGLMASSPSLMTSNPVLATSKPSLMLSNSSYIPTNLLTPKSEIGKSNRGKKKAKDGKIINILSTSIIKPADQPHRDYKSKSSDSKKSAGKPKKVETKGQKKYEVKPHKDPEEWENVMDAICKQKTPCRGPNALDLALNKSSFEKAFEDSLRKPSPLFTSPKSSTQQDQIDDDDQFTQTTKTVHVSPSSGNIQSNKKIRSLVKSKKKDNSKTKKIIIEELRQSSIEPNAITALMLQNQIEITRKHSDIPEKTQKHIINPTNATHVETTKIVAQPSLIEINKNVLKQNNAETPKKDVKQIIVDTTKKEFAQVSVGFKKISENNKIKQSTYAGLNQDKHYMSTTRNSDYDLLDELMDDDLRKEIGELSSDEEEYAAAARGFVKGNKGMDKPVTISYNTSSKDMAMTSPASSLCKQNNMAQSYTQKPNEQPFNIKPALKMPTVPNQNKPGICLNAAQNVTTHVVTKPTQAHTLSVANDTLSTQITIERNMYVTAVPQTATNVMLIPSDLVYEGYSSIQTPIQTVTNIVPNVYVAVNTPGISMYQTTQCAVTVPVVNNIQCVTAIQSPVTNVTQSQYYYPNNDLLQLAHLATAQEKIVVNDNNLETNQCNIVNEHTVENVKQRTHENQISVDVNINKSGERKVLQEAQDKQAEEIKIPDDIHINKGGERKVLQQVQEKQADKTIDCKRRSQQFDVKDVKSQADKERLIKKRMAILNRKISHYCGVQPIALGYSPLRVVTVEKKELEIMDKKSSEEEYDHPSLQNNLQELINDVKSPATPDSYKENKSESVEVRRILLRSSNKLKNKTSSPATSPKPSIDRKMKALPAVALDTTTETSSEINQSNIETNDKPKRVSKRILNKFATTPKDTKRTEGSNMLTGKKVTPKMSKMKKLKYVSNTNANAATHEDFDTDQFFDIEAELLGSTIPKIIPSDLHKIDLPEISALEINIEEKELTPDYKDAESLPIEEEQLQQVTGLLVNTYTMIDNTDNPATDLNTINKSEDIINVNNENNSTFELKISKTEVTVKGEVMTKKDMIGNVEKQSTSQVVPESTKSNDSKTNNVGIPNPVSPGASLVSEIMNTLTLPSAQTPIKTTIDEKVQTLTAKENNNLDENNPEVGNDGDKSSVREIEKAHTSVSEIINCDENTSKVVNYNYNSDKTTCEIRKPQTIVSAIINFEENAFKVDHDSDKTGCEIEKAQTVSEITNFEENSSTVGHDIDKTICEIEKSQTTVSEIMNFKENAPKVCHDNTKHDDFQIKSTQKNTAINISSEIVSRPVCNTAAEDDDDDLQIIEDLSSSLNPSPAHKLKPPQNNLINDNFVIENIPNCYTGDPLKKVVRIKLGNGKTFKGTISGSENIDKLLCNPEIKSLLKSQLEQSKGLYSLKLNINKDLTNGDKILSTRIEHDVKTSHPRVPFETVSLLSDDEDEDKASPQVFDTEFGKHLINSLDRELFTKHQSKLKLKSYVKVKKLSLEEEYVIKRRSLRNMAKPNIRVQQNSKSLDDAVTIVDSPTSLMCSKIFDQAKILTAIPSKYVKGIFNDIENILAPANKQKAKEPVVLIDDSSNDSINDGQKPKPKEKINEFKNMLLKDLGVMDNAILATTESKDEVENTLAAESIDLTDDSVLEPTDKVNKQENYHDIINRNYFVKLVRCDEIVNNLKLRLVPTHSGIETTQIEEIDVPASRSRSGSFSILEDLPVVVDTQLNSNNERDNSSPVMEVYETIASLEGKFPAVRNTYKPPDDAIKCNSEWMITKNIERAQTLNSLTPALESRHTLVVPKLSTLTLTIIQDGDLVSKYVSRFRQPPSLKRKSKPSILPIAKVSKIDYISNEPLSNDCSQSSTITLHVSTTDAYIVAITEGKLQTESLDITPALSDTYVASITVSDINDDDVDRNNEELEKFKVSSIIEESTTCKDGVDIQSYYNDNDTVLVHADDQENREQDITLESPHSLTVFEEHLSSDITKYVSEETSRLQNDEIPNDDSKIEFYSVENHDISKKADSMHSAPPEKEYDNSTTIVTAISHNDDARALDNDDKSVMSIGDVKVRDGDHMDTNEIEALSKIASEESDGDVSCTAQNHLQDNNAKSIIVVHADDQENREQDITLESPHSLTVFEEHSSSDITKYVSEETSRLQNDEIPNDDSKIEFYSVENHDISKKADSMHSAPPEKEYDNSTTIVTAISHNDDARALDNDDKSVMSIGDVKVRGGDHMDTNEIEALSKIASEESDGDVSCTAQNHLQDNNAKSIIELSSNTIEGFGMHIDGVEVSGNIEIETNQLEKSLSIVSEKFVGDISSTEFEHLNDRLDNAESIVALQENNIKDLSYTEQVVDNKSDSIAEEDNSALEVIDSTAAPDALNKTVESHNKIEELNKEETHEKCIGEVQSAIFTMSEKSCLATTIKILNTDTTIQKELLEETSCKTPNEEPQTSDKYVSQEKLHCEVQNTHNLKCVNILEKEIFINNINLAPETTKPLKRPFNELAENNTYKLETLSKSSSPISSPLQTTDEIIDALNKMFGESEGTAINEHSQGKLSSKANELNEYCFSKQNETSYSPIKTINKKKDLDSYKLSSENRSTQSGKDAPEIQETQSEREARIPKHRDEVFAALHKLFGEPDDVNSMDSSDVIINENEECIQDVDSQLKDDDDDEANNTTRENLCIPDSGSEILVEGDMLHKNIKDGITFTSTLVSNESEKEIKILEYNHDSVSSEENQNILDKIIQSTTKEVPEIDINGIVYEDTDIGTRYVISIIQEVSENNEQANPSLESNENIAINCDDEIIEDLKLNVPKFTYAYSSTVMHNMVRRSSRNMKRKKDMSDTKTSERKYRKGKNIDYPKITQSAIAELAYSKEYKRIIDYGNTIKFSYARPFHIDHIDVANMHKAWPIKECHAVDVKNAKDAKDLLYTDIEDTKNNTAITDPLQQTLNDEIVNGHKVNEYKSIDINETNFNMGFGERSGRVIQKLETGIEKLSAATLSDVKQYQPFSLSEASPETQNIAQELETQKVKFARFMNFINMKAKVQSVFKKTAFELNKEFFEQDKKMESKESKFPFDLTSSEFMEVPVETIVNVVQVGQLSVSANAQNSLTCDPRVTHVSDASPSQCSNNSPSEDSQATMETEYTELTTANITLPLVQEYANHHQSPPSQEQNSPGNDDDGNVSTLSIVKIELMEEEDTQENRENDIYENDFSPLPNNNVQYSFEDTSNTLFNTSAIADNTSTNTHNTSNNMFNASSNIDNSFTNIFSNSTNMDNTYTNIDNTPSTMESTYTNMDNGSTSMYSTSSNMGNSSTEMDNNDHMNEGSPDTNTTTTTNLDNNASADMDNSYTSIYNPITTDSNDMSNTTTNMCNTTSNLDESAIDLENRATNMNTSPNMENSAYDYTYESIEDYAANIENNNNPDNYSTNVDTYPQNVDNYSTTVSDYGSNIESYSSNGENYVNNTENYPTGVEHYSTNIDNYASDAENYATNIDNTISNVDNNIPNIDSSTAKLLEDTQPQDLSMGNSTEESKICNTFEDLSPDSETARRDQIAHAMTAAGIASESVITSGADELANLMSQSDQATANNYSKSTPINVMTLQQALSQVLPPPLNQTSPPERQMPSNPSGQQVLHIVQGSNAQTVINKPNGTHLLHIVQNKNNPNANGLSLVDAGLQQGGNQLIHIVNNGNQNNAQFLKRVNLLTNLTNAQGSNEQKMIQFVCKSADGKSIQLNTGHQRSMVLRLHPTNVQTPAKPTEPQDLSTSPTTSAASNPGNNQDSSQGIKSRSVYEENYAQFIQDSAPTPGSSTTSHEKATSLPKFNQVFGKQSYQENQNQIDHNGLQENPEPCQPEENNTHIEQSAEVNNPSLLVRNTTTETTPPTSNPTQPIKQTISPMNLHTTMHGGVIYTRQIPVNIGGGQTINLITVPSTELVDDPAQKQQTEGAFVNQEGEQSSIIKLVPHHASNNNTNVTPEENNVQAGPSSEANHTPQPQPQPQPVLTQMRIKLPMLSKGPHIVPGTRLVRPSFFQIQRNVIAGTNQPVYQQLVLTTAPSLGQSIRLPAQQPQSAQSPQAQPILVQAAQNTQASPHIPVQQVQHAPSSQHVHSAQQAHSAQQSHSTATTSQPQSVQSDHSKPDNEPDSELSTLTLEQLREFDMVLEQVKERSVQPTPSTTPSTPVLPKPAPADSTDGPALATTSVTESTQQVLYSVDNNQPSNVVSYVNRKSTITSATTSFVRSPDSSGIVDTPSSSSSSSQVQITHTVTSKSSTVDGNTAVLPHPKKKKKKKSSSSSSAMASLGSPSKSNSLKPQEDEQTTQRILYILAEYKEQVENSPDKNKPAPRRRNQFPLTTGSKRKRSHCSSRSMCRREGVDMSPMHEHGENGEDSLITLGSEDSSCGTTFSECTECQESHSPDQDSPTKVVRRLTFEQETTTTQITQTRTIPQRNVIVGDGQTITVARTTTATTAKPTTTVLMPANYLLPVSMIKGGQQIAIMTNRGPKILVGAGDTNAGALLFQRLIGPGLKPVLARPGVRHIRLPATALHNLQTFNIQTTPVTQVQPPDSTAPPAPTPAPPDLIDTRAMSSPWQDREAQEKPMRGPSPDCTEPWNMPSSSIADDYGYEEIVRTDNMERTVLVVQQRKDGRHHRVTHVSTAALRHKYAILEHELRLQKSLSEECEDLGVDSPSASDLFPEADILFGAPSPAHEQTIDQCNTPPPIPIPQSIPQPDLDDQIATDHLLTHTETRNDDIDLNLDDVGEIVTVGEDGTATISTINAEEFARSHPNTTFHTEPEEGEITITQPPFTIAQGIKGRHITFHANRVPGTVVMAPQTTVISQAIVNSNDNSNTVKFTDIDNMINAMPCPQPVTTKPSVLVKDPGITSRPLSKFDTLKKDPSTSTTRSSSKYDSKFDSLKETSVSNPRSSSKYDAKFNNLKDSGGSTPRSLSKFDSLKESSVSTSRSSSKYDSKFDSLKEPSPSTPKPLSKFDSLLTESKLHLSNATARQVVHSTGHGAQVIRRLRHDDRPNPKTNSRFHFDEPRPKTSMSDEVKMRNDRALVESMGDNASSPGQPELFWDSSTPERQERRFHFSENDKATKSPFDELLNDSSAYGPHTRLDSVIKAARPERTYGRTSFEGISVSGSSEETRPLRTYPPKRAHTQHTQDMERHFTLKTTTTTHHHELGSTTKTTHHQEERSKKSMPRCQESEGRRRTGRGLVKRGCSCCTGSSAPPKKRSRPKKPSHTPTDCSSTPNS